MKKFYLFFLLLLSFATGFTQTTIALGPASGTTYLVPFVSQCLNTAVQNATVCSGGVIGSFNFTSVQCCACPSSGQICLPGSVAYGGPGTSGSFINYHTLSYSPSNEHQQFFFSGPITKFQFSVAGPAGASEIFQAQTYNGATLLSTHTFATGGTGVKFTYTISGPAFTRVQFTEINAVSADDELFGDIYIDAGTCAILPFELLDFSAQPINDREVGLSWKTNGEIENAFFVAEHSSDGSTWTELGSVPGAGTTRNAQSYEMIDHAAYPGMNYYRLRTVDFQGEDHYSQVLAVNMNENRAQVVVYPNPMGDWLHFNFGNITGNIELNFVNQLGQVVKQKLTTESLSALEVADLPAGAYTLRITLPNGTISNHSVLKK